MTRITRITVTGLALEETAVYQPMKPAHEWVGNGRGRLARLIKALGVKVYDDMFISAQKKSVK